MSYRSISAGKNPPDELHVVIEIPANNVSIKYEIDKELDVLMVDRFLSTAMFYPCNYGYIPNTLSEDGDALDTLVLAPMPLIPGSVICCRPVGVLEMTDEAGFDNKILAVPINKLTLQYQAIKNVSDLAEQDLAMISHFFEQYKALETGKWVKVEGWKDVSTAKEVIRRCIANYKP